MENIITIPHGITISNQIVVAPATNTIINDETLSRSFCKCLECGVINSYTNTVLLSNQAVCECSESLENEVDTLLSYLTNEDFKNEVWRDFHDYRVSTIGRVYSYKKKRIISPNMKSQHSAELLYYNLVIEGERVCYRLPELVALVWINCN